MKQKTWTGGAVMVMLLSFGGPIVTAEPLLPHQLEALAAEGDANAQWLLGQPLVMGTLEAADGAQAVRWLTRAAEQGHGLAQRDLGLLYELGRGVDQDAREAYFWYSLASRQESGRARLRRDALAATMTSDQIEAVAARLLAWRKKQR